MLGYWAEEKKVDLQVTGKKGHLRLRSKNECINDPPNEKCTLASVPTIESGSFRRQQGSRTVTATQSWHKFLER